MYLKRRADIAAEIEATFLPEVPEDRRAQFRKLLVGWMVDWEAPAKVQRRRATTALDPHTRLTELSRLQEANAERLERVIKDMKEQSTATFTDAQIYRIFVNTSRDLQKDMEQVAAHMDVEDQWGAEKEKWMRQKRAIHAKVYKEYRGKGEVYSMLCDRLAALQVGLSRLEDLGRIDSEQYKNLSEQFVATVAQIQKHTESLKVEDVSPLVQQVGQKFMQILEAHLYNQPALMDSILGSIEKNVIEGRFEAGEKVRLLEAKTA